MQKIYGGAQFQDLFQGFAEFHSPTDLYNRNYSQDLLAFPEYGQLLDKLIAKKILISSEDEDRRMLLHRKSKAQAMQKISLMYFVPTDQCNYSCRYCFVENKVEQHTMMTQAVSRSGIDYFASQSRGAREVKVIFYGGEPLLNKPVVYDAWAYLRQVEAEGGFAAKLVTLTLLTNGSLVDQETVAMAKRFGVRTGVSIDGTEALHNRNRCFAGGLGCFEESVRGYRLLQEAGLNPSISCTLTRDNIDRFEEMLAFILDELKPSGLGFNILLPKWNEPYRGEPESATLKIIEAFKVMRQRGVYEDRMMRRARPFCSDTFHYKDCHGVGGQIVLTPAGRIGPCQAYMGLDEYYPVSIPELPEDINSHPMFAKWIQRFTLNNQECLSCRALAICGGGCPYAAEVTTGSIEGIDRRICQQCLPIFDWLIWDLFDQLTPPHSEEQS